MTVYAIGELEHPPLVQGEQRRVLQQIMEVGGKRSLNGGKGLDAVYARSSPIRAQYTVGYLSTNERNRRRLAQGGDQIVRKAGRDLRVRSRKGYLALQETERLVMVD